MLVDNEQKFFRMWHGEAISIFLFVSTSEILQYFSTYALACILDLFDFVAYTGWILLGVLLDTQVISKYYLKMYK
jgi:hypothetical protein